MSLWKFCRADSSLGGTPCLVKTSHTGCSGLVRTELVRCLQAAVLSGKEDSGLQKHKAAYWVYDHKAEVEAIVAERKAAGNSRDACRVAKRKFALLKDKWWNERADRLERAAETGDLKLQYQLSKEGCGPTVRRPISFPFPGIDRATKSAKETVDAFHQHFERVLSQDRSVDHAFVSEKLEQRPVAEVLDQPITRKEVEEAVKSLQNAKAPGVDGLSPEIWKVGGKITDYLVEACKKGFNGDVPKEWVDCKIIPIHKKGTRNDPDNYRGIELLSTGGKVFGRILARRLLRHIVPHVVPESQCGYRPGRSTEDLIFVAHQLFEKAKEKNTTLYAVFVDFSKAFDSVDRDLLWLVLTRRVYIVGKMSSFKS